MEFAFFLLPEHNESNHNAVLFLVKNRGHIFLILNPNSIWNPALFSPLIMTNATIPAFSERRRIWNEGKVLDALCGGMRRRSNWASPPPPPLPPPQPPLPLLCFRFFLRRNVVILLLAIPPTIHKCESRWPGWPRFCFRFRIPGCALVCWTANNKMTYHPKLPMWKSHADGENNWIRIKNLCSLLSRGEMQLYSVKPLETRHTLC